jgi:hypothetical protein
MNAKLRLNHMLGCAIALLALGATGATHAQNTINVPADHPTIQAAISAAQNGDTIVVAPGTYNEAINFQNKAIHLRSSDGPEVTTIDATGLNTSVVTCGSGEGPNTILDGFTITGGNATQGGGMRNAFSSPTVIDCVFIGNHASVGGGASNSSGSEATFSNCRFIANTATNNGGGVHNITATTATFNNCLFAGNSASSGGAVWNSLGTFCSSHITGTTFCENTPNDIFGPWHNHGGNEFLKECPVDCAKADLNCDGVVDVLDLLILLDNWGECKDCKTCDADLDDNCLVDVLDLLILLDNWG